MEEAGFILAIRDAPQDDAPRLVYSDWLEETGDVVSRLKAQFLRLTVEQGAVSRSGGNDTSQRLRLQQLARRLDANWLERVSRTPEDIRKDDAFWSAARSRIAGLKRMDSRFEFVFGSKGHQYEVSPPVSEAQIQSFEAANGVALPAEYRSFLALCGSGGAGPDYGIYDFLALEAANVREAFPLTDTRSWPEDDGDPLWRLPGLLTLSTSGCGIDWFLEVNGRQPGTMWVNAGPGDQLMRCESFGTWYGNWLNRVEFGSQKHHIIRDMIEAKASLQEVKEAAEVEPYEYTTEGARYLRFPGIPGRIRLDGGKIVTLELGTCWIQ